MGNVDPAGRDKCAGHSLGRVEEPGQRGWPELGRGQALGDPLDLGAGEDHSAGVTRHTWGQCLQKSEVQIPDWESGQKGLLRTQPGNSGLQGARVLPAFSASPGAEEPDSGEEG